MQQDDSCNLWNHSVTLTDFVPGAPSSMLTHLDAEGKHPVTAISIFDFFPGLDFSYFLLFTLTCLQACMETGYNRKATPNNKISLKFEYLSDMARFQGNILLFK